MGENLTNSFLFVYLLLTINQNLALASFIGDSKYTGFGTLIGNYTANSKIPKMFDVDSRLKQRVLIQFLTAEKVSREEIQERLHRQFGDEGIDIDEEESPKELEKRRKLHYNVVERVIIQFLDAEGERPMNIYKRLRNVSNHGQHLCNVYRWAHKFREGRRDVANQQANKYVCVDSQKNILNKTRLSVQSQSVEPKTN
uniref:Mos1 transposase HTH domain-containing protein n=1 Tax=Graphocephala atropunctata TaxID=36148 RepID=A0A1B6M6E2_9HEMI